VALTLRVTSETGATTKGSELTHAELDANFVHLHSSSGINFTQSGTGASSRTVSAKLLEVLSVTDFGCLGDGSTDDTSNFNEGIAEAKSSGRALFMPQGQYKTTSTLTSIDGQFHMFGEGMQESEILFVPTAGDVCIDVSNGASRVERVYLHDFAIKSTETTFQKIALDLYDTSMCQFERIFIWGSGGAGPSANACWSGANSIGIRTHGREVTAFKDIEIIADAPIYMAANPNTSATDGEDSDHFHFENMYLVGNGNPLVEVAAGLGVMELTFDGFQAWVAGTAGFKINDTRSSPNVPSRGLLFANVRREQGTSASDYVFDMTFTEPVQRVTIRNTLMATGSNGIKIDGFHTVLLDQVTAAMTSTQLLTANATATSVLILKGFYGQSTGTFTTTGLTRIMSSAYNSATRSAPSDAVYAGQITGTQANVEQVTVTAANTAVAFKVTGTTGDQFQALCGAAGNGVTTRTLNNGGTDYEPWTHNAEFHDLKVRTGTLTSATSILLNSTGAAMGAYRFKEKQGATVTAANSLALGSDGNYFQVDGTTQINLIANTNWQGGAVVTLKFNASVTVAHNQAASGDNKPLLLSGAANFSATANDTLTLRYDSTDSAWYEMSRTVI
jgi:hypothetical protein